VALSSAVETVSLWYPPSCENAQRDLGRVADARPLVKSMYALKNAVSSDLRPCVSLALDEQLRR
jgi:hypothetical protein